MGSFFHLFAFGKFFFVFYYFVTYITQEEQKVRGYTFGGPYVYLTILAMVSFFLKIYLRYRTLIEFISKVVQIIYYAIALINDFVPANGLKELRNYIFASLAVPLAFETTLMYWGLVSIDRELAFPKALDAFFPLWLDIGLHTNITIFIVLELILEKHDYPRRSAAMRGLIVFMLSYLVWIYYVFINTGKWVYGVIEIFSAPQRILFFVICGVVTLVLYLIGESMNKFVSGSRLEHNDDVMKKRKVK